MNSRVTTGLAILCFAASAAFMAPRPNAQTYPQRPVTVVAPNAPGSGPDVVTRIVMDRLSQAWGRQVVVVNRPGAGGLVGARAFSSASPDGYTLFLPQASVFTVLPVISPMPLDVQRDLRPVSLVGEMPMFIAVAATLGVSTLDELIALTRKQPGQLNYGASRGAFTHMAMELLKARSGVDITFVPHAGARQVLNELMGGRISVGIESVSVFSSAADQGKVRLIAVASEQRLPHYPRLATVSETIAGFQARGWLALMAPAGVADEIVVKIHRDVGDVLADSGVRERLSALGTYSRPLSPEQVADFIRSEQQLWRPMVNQVGASLQ